MFEDWVAFGYLLSAILFVFGLKKLGHPRTAPRGNQYGMMGMAVAVITNAIWNSCISMKVYFENQAIHGSYRIVQKNRF